MHWAANDVASVVVKTVDRRQAGPGRIPRCCCRILRRGVRVDPVLNSCFETGNSLSSDSSDDLKRKPEAGTRKEQLDRP